MAMELSRMANTDLEDQIIQLIKLVRFAVFILTLFLIVGLVKFMGYDDIPGLLRRLYTDTLHPTPWPSQSPSSAPSPLTHLSQSPHPTRFKASDHIDDKKRHLLLACTGSVATIKLPNIINSLSSFPNLSIRVLLSASASKFLQGQSPEQPSLKQISRLPNVDGIYFDAYEWEKPWVRGDSIAHIEFRRWADLMVIAPLSANALARVVNGVSDDLITSVVRAWDATGLIDVARPGVPLPYGGGTRKGIVVAPAMNTAMWEHPVTKRQMEFLSREWSVDVGGWVEVLRPIEKELACGDSGSGAMRSWEEVAATIKDRLSLKE